MSEMWTRHDDGHGKAKSLWFRYRALLGYLVLAAGMLYSVGTVSQQAGERREALATSAKVVVVEGCKRDNDTRAALRQIINRSAAELDSYVKEGTITEQQAERARKANNQALANLGPVDCNKAAAQIAQQP